jgi:GNAT superfamily N-acetyltransferase
MGPRPHELRIEIAGPDDAAIVCRLVDRLLRELGEEGEETGALEVARLRGGWSALPPGAHTALLARLGSGGEAIGVATLSECFALYAGGLYGILNEMYVTPEQRSSGVGRLLIEAVKETARARGWRRVDVTAPEALRFERTRRFYEREGFRFTGPKLKWLAR